jgi:hypothetical protein
VLGSLAAGSLRLLTTGAFSTVEASRTATVETAGDADALLGIKPVEGESEQFVNDADGTVNIDIPNVNKNSITAIDQLLEVTNNGTENVTVGFVAEYADQRGDFNNSVEVPPYGYTYATNDTADVGLVMWASPKESEIDETYADIRPVLVTTGFEGSSLVNGIRIDEEITNTVNDGNDGNGRRIDPGESVNIGLVIDTRDDTIDQSGDSRRSDENIKLVAEISENIDPVSDSN